jgi:hypothetical protein
LQNTRAAGMKLSVSVTYYNKNVVLTTCEDSATGVMQTPNLMVTFLGGRMHLMCQRMPRQRHRQVLVAFPLCCRTVSPQCHQPFPHLCLRLFVCRLLYSILHQNKRHSTKNVMALVVKTVLIHLGCAALAPTSTANHAVSNIRLLLERGASRKVIPWHLCRLKLVPLQI